MLCTSECSLGGLKLTAKCSPVCLLQALTFAALADPKYGSMAIEYQQVPCSPPGNMIAHVTDSRGQGGWSRFGIEVGEPQVFKCMINEPSLRHPHLNPVFDVIYYSEVERIFARV